MTRWWRGAGAMGAPTSVLAPATCPRTWCGLTRRLAVRRFSSCYAAQISVPRRACRCVSRCAESLGRVPFIRLARLLTERDFLPEGESISVNGWHGLASVRALYDYDTAVAFRDDVDRQIDLIGGARAEN